LAANIVKPCRVFFVEVLRSNVQEPRLLIEANFCLSRNPRIIPGQYCGDSRNERLRTSQSICGVDLGLVVLVSQYSTEHAFSHVRGCYLY